MAALKFHPRDTLPNRTTLARADALYTELTKLAREELGHAIAAFRGALESQDPDTIIRVRGTTQRPGGRTPSAQLSHSTRAMSVPVSSQVRVGPGVFGPELGGSSLARQVSDQTISPSSQTTLSPSWHWLHARPLPAGRSERAASGDVAVLAAAHDDLQHAPLEA